MRLSLLSVVAIGSGAIASYSGDIVQYWNDQSALLVNGTVIGGLQSPPSAWYGAVVQGAIYEAAVKSKFESLEFQQLAVSHAAHNIIIWAFHGTRNYNAVNAALRDVLPQIGLAANSTDAKKATEIGRKAARKVAEARADDGLNDYVPYVHGPAEPGVYQATPNGNPFPDVPQSRFQRHFAALGDITKFRAPPPPAISTKEAEENLLEVLAIGRLNSTERSAYDTDTAYFWRESSITMWNRLAHSVIGNSLAKKVAESAKFYAQLNYALFNAGIASWDTKYAYDVWRPITAIHRTDVFLPSGKNVSDPSWTPLLRPTPSHPDYSSTHSAFGAAAAAVIAAWNGGDEVNASLSSNVTLDARGVITRTFTSLKAASKENSRSRVLAGVHFTFATTAGEEIGEAVALATLKNFDEHWDEF